MRNRENARVWLSDLSQGLGIALGFSGIVYEFGFDHLAHWPILITLFGAMGISIGNWSVLTPVMAMLARNERLSLSIGPVRFEMMQAHDDQPSPAVIRVPSELPAADETPSSPSDRNHPSTRLDADTPP